MIILSILKLASKKGNALKYVLKSSQSYFMVVYTDVSNVRLLSAES